MVKRRATHAGSWYTSDASKLDAQLSQWLAAVKSDQFPSPVEVASQTPSTTDPLDWPISDARAVISPHAGYSYSGPPAAYSYGAIPADKKHIKRIFILGPSHHYYLPGCALSKCSAYETPLGDLPLDRELIESLYDQGKSSGDWEWMERDTDEDEHSIEMQLPYLRKIFQG
jgi:MEMO1 family protein